jgi:hypothetical protein
MIEEALSIEPVAVSDSGMMIYEIVYGVADDEVIAGFHGEAPELYIIEYDDDGNACFDGSEYYMNEFIRLDHPAL